MNAADPDVLQLTSRFMSMTAIMSIRSLRRHHHTVGEPDVSDQHPFACGEDGTVWLGRFSTEMREG
jgi:hypothetical protein